MSVQCRSGPKIRGGATAGRRFASLNDLPDELLLNIIEHLDKTSRRAISQSYIGHIRFFGRFSTVYVLSQVNRRFRAIARPLVRIDLDFNDYVGFADGLKKLQENSSKYKRNNLIRSINLKGGYTDCDKPDLFRKTQAYTLLSHLAKVSLPNLTSLSCGDIVFTSDDVSAITKRFPKLRSLSVVLDDLTGFPGPDALSQLEELRVRVVCLRSMVYTRARISSVPTQLSVPSLTRLALSDVTLARWDRLSMTVTSCLNHVSLPNLQVLTLRKANLDAVDVFDFVHRHPTLLEVNVNLGYTDFFRARLDALFTLIDGTGTWRIPPSLEPLAASEGIQVQQCTFPRYAWRTYPYVFDFAFSRRPLSAESIQWRSPFGSKYPRYEATALAIDLAASPRGPHRIPAILDSVASAHLESIEVLRIATDWDQHEGNNRSSVCFDQFMIDMASSLHRFTRLRSVSLSWTITVSDYEDSRWVWEKSDFRELDQELFLVEVVPPLYKPKRATAWSFLTLGDILQGASYEETQYVQGNLKDVYTREGEDLDLNLTDPAIIMKAWAANNRCYVSDAARELARRCPLLEEFTWYPLNSAWDDPILQWKWAIKRSKTGSIQLISDKFTWTGCSQGDPPRLWLLVGNELEVALRERHTADSF